MWITTGQVLSRQNIEDVIKFAKRERLFILADEVKLLNFNKIASCLHSNLKFHANNTSTKVGISQFL
jgi:aspartate/methionine/tyrosine aminotransferase